MPTVSIEVLRNPEYLQTTVATFEFKDHEYTGEVKYELLTPEELGYDPDPVNVVDVFTLDLDLLTPLSKSRSYEMVNGIYRATDGSFLPASLESCWPEPFSTLKVVKYVEETNPRLILGQRAKPKPAPSETSAYDIVEIAFSGIDPFLYCDSTKVFKLILHLGDFYDNEVIAHFSTLLKSKGKSALESVNVIYFHSVKVVKYLLDNFDLENLTHLYRITMTEDSALSDLRQRYPRLEHVFTSFTWEVGNQQFRPSRPCEQKSEDKFECGLYNLSYVRVETGAHSLCRLPESAGELAKKVGTFQITLRTVRALRGKSQRTHFPLQ